jgi:NAD(P)-dependent dehydrogenase (short-subunit alcohol dehydrogenase family)
MWEVDGTEWWRTFETNVSGAFALTSAVSPEMLAADGGRELVARTGQDRDRGPGAGEPFGEQPAGAAPAARRSGSPFR